MSDLSTWQQLMDVSATMLGFIFLAMTTLIARAEKDRISVEDARTIMIGAIVSFVQFLASFGLSLYIVTVENQVDRRVQQVAITYLVLGFLSAGLVALIIIVQWLRQTNEDSEEVES